MKRIWKFIEDWIWQLPQNLCGIVYKSSIKDNIISSLNTDSDYIISLKRSNGGVTLGKYIFVYQRYSDLSKVIQHETGHAKQSRILGPLYLIVIGIPSIIHTALHKKVCSNDNYYHFYTESWANKLAGLKVN